MIQKLQTRPAALTVAVADMTERAAIYRVRHDVYARELAQHRTNDVGHLSDGLDEYNEYLVAKADGELAGFVSVTPPGRGAYSVDKYFPRDPLPFAFDDGLHEVRLLTVLQPYRRSDTAALLMYAALRWIEAHGGTRVVVIGRRELRDLYTRIGLQPLGLSAQAGAVVYELMTATTEACRRQMNAFAKMLDRLEHKTDWQLNFPFHPPAPCFHGGAFFDSVGVKFDALDRSSRIINADVLDAWFSPSPKVLSALSDHLPWLLRTSPPVACEGMIETIAEARGLRPENILPGAGSSDLIFRALCRWLGPASRALILDPTYGEYAHVLERVIGCTVDRLNLRREDRYTVDLGELEAALARRYDLIVLVNPNSPTGRHIPRTELEALLSRAPPRARIWIDETYVDYAGPDQSLEAFACRSENVVVCKSMSKAYALSGARVGYLAGGRHQIEDLRAITPPWTVGLPSQVAAVAALQDPDYYTARHMETAALRERLAAGLTALGLDVVPGIANFVLCHLQESGPNAAMVVKGCRERDLFVRDAGQMGRGLGGQALRIAVKDEVTSQKMLRILAEVIATSQLGPDAATISAHGECLERPFGRAFLSRLSQNRG